MQAVVLLAMIACTVMSVVAQGASIEAQIDHDEKGICQSTGARQSNVQGGSDRAERPGAWSLSGVCSSVDACCLLVIICIALL